MAIDKEVLDRLLAGRNLQELFAKDGLPDELKRVLLERMLSAELGHRLIKRSHSRVEASWTIARKFFIEHIATGGNAAEVLELAEEALDQVAFTIEHLAEAEFPLAIGFGRYVGNRALRLDQIADAIGVISLVRQNDSARIETIKQAESGGAVVAEPAVRPSLIGST